MVKLSFLEKTIKYKKIENIDGYWEGNVMGSVLILS